MQRQALVTTDDLKDVAIEGKVAERHVRGPKLRKIKIKKFLKDEVKDAVKDT
jgi:hypothetical protein